MTLLLLSAITACTSTEPEVEEETPAGPFAYALYSSCSAVELISDGWNSGTEDYIETFTLNAFGQWDVYDFFAPYHGDRESAYIEYRSYDQTHGLPLVGEGNAMTSGATSEDQIFERNEAGQVTVESLRLPEDAKSEYDATYTYVEDYEGCMAAGQALNAKDLYRHEPCTSRIEYDYYMNGEIDEVATTSYDAEFRWVQTTRDTNNDGTPENTCTFEWNDKNQATSMDCVLDGYALSEVNTYDGAGRLVEASVVNDMPNVWGEYTSYLNWSCD